MMHFLEYVTERTVLLRHPNMTDTVRRFFADEDTGQRGYIFHVFDTKDSPNVDDTGRFYKLVTSYDTLSIQRGTDEEPTLVCPSQIELELIRRQFNNNEWISGPFRGRLDRVAAVDINDTAETESPK
jgi:hypothetical protein